MQLHKEEFTITSAIKVRVTAVRENADAMYHVVYGRICLLCPIVDMYQEDL